MSTTPEERSARARAMADEFLVGHVTGLEGREEEFMRAVMDAVRTIGHTRGYPHETNDALVMEYLTGVRFARKHGMVDEFNDEHVEVMTPVLERVRGVIAETGEREVALEAMCGWSTCHYQLVVTGTHKEPGRRWFLSPFTTALDAGVRVGQFDFDEDYVVTETFFPRLHGYAKRLEVPVVTEWDPATRVISVALAD